MTEETFVVNGQTICVSGGQHAGELVIIMKSGPAGAVFVKGVVHILKPSSSSYGMTLPSGLRRQYACQDGCCDRGLRLDVANLVLLAKEFGATKVILRTGQRQYAVQRIHDLPVEDVSAHVGQVIDGMFIDRR
jgi:hypothetical protein